MATLSCACMTVWSIWSEANFASAVSRVAWACSTSLCSVGVWSVANTAPAFTTCPTLTLTALTVPATAKLTVAWVAGSRVPVAEVVSRTSPMVAASVR